MVKLESVSVIGLGKLGSPMLAVFASKGYRVTGVDINSSYVEMINSARAPVYEPGLEEYLTANRDNITATSSYPEAVKNSDITFIIVPTPSNPAGGSRIFAVGRKTTGRD